MKILLLLLITCLVFASVMAVLYRAKRGKRASACCSALPSSKGTGHSCGSRCSCR